MENRDNALEMKPQDFTKLISEENKDKTTRFRKINTEKDKNQIQSNILCESVKSCDSKWLYKDITEKIIGAAIEVHKVLGSGFLEYVYQESLCHELKLRNLTFELQKELDIWYKDLLIPKKYIPDFIISDCVIVEIKATSGLIENDEAQLLNYLKVTKIKVGLLLNFGKKSLEIKRRIL